MKLNDFEKWLDTFLNFEKTQKKNIFWLDTIKFLCKKLDNPQDKIPCIHVAGSKGKGSVSVMIASILESSGYKCGIYTSPHILDFRERIKRPFDFLELEVYEKAADVLVNTVNSISIDELPGQRNITWFELVTVYSFLCFLIAKVDYVVYEVGLGGRLDSTNVVTPLLSCIMPIELEHTEFLGNTVELIAQEKGGIIKPKIPVLISYQNYKSVNKIFINMSKKQDSCCFLVEDLVKNLDCNLDLEKGLMNVSFDLLDSKEKIEANLKLLGKVQAQNATVACCAVKKILSNINTNQIKQGLEKAFLQGRYEVVRIKEYIFILDGAHTVNSLKNTIETTKKLFNKKSVSLIFGCASDKDINQMTLLFDGFSKIYLTKPSFSRALDLDILEKAFSSFIDKNRIYKKETVTSILDEIFNTNKSNEKIFLVTGSFYLVSDVKSYFNLFNKS